MKTNKQTNCESNENPNAALLVANDNTIHIHIHIHTRASLKPIKGSRRLLLLHLFSSCFGHRIARTSNGSLYTIVPLCSERRDATRRRFSFSFHHRPSAEMMMMMMMMIAPFPFFILSTHRHYITNTHTCTRAASRDPLLSSAPAERRRRRRRFQTTTPPPLPPPLPPWLMANDVLH